MNIRPLVFASAFGLLLAANVLSQAAATGEQDNFDRLDGKGASGKKVDVIEWAGNLEVHVYPGGSLAGLALKLDKKNKDKPVMVIGYRFAENPKQQLIRRAILGIDLRDGFKAYRDPSSGSEYDKVVISNNGLAGELVAYKLDPEPQSLYPEGHPALAQKPEDKKRVPASQDTSNSGAAQIDADGTIKPFLW